MSNTHYTWNNFRTTNLNCLPFLFLTKNFFSIRIIKTYHAWSIMPPYFSGWLEWSQAPGWSWKLHVKDGRAYSSWVHEWVRPGGRSPSNQDSPCHTVTYVRSKHLLWLPLENWGLFITAASFLGSSYHLNQYGQLIWRSGEKLPLLASK